MEYEVENPEQALPLPPVLVASPNKKMKTKTPQTSIDQFWGSFTTKFPGKPQRILPANVYANTKAAKSPKGVVHGQAALKSYEQASAECIAAVEKIAKECRRVNMKYRDPHFDIEFDLKSAQGGTRDCLDGLLGRNEESAAPKSVKRVPDIFENPTFYYEGATASDVRQGLSGDCWFLSALCALGSEKNLIDKVCVKRDEKVGVYGFVFHRDGEWIQTVIDDKLYLIASDWYESIPDEKRTFAQTNRQDAEEKYRKSCQTGSDALYFAKCSSENETWLPLLEKAYAKAHGDYSAIDGGFFGEALEDLTGGVTTELFTTDILDTEKFWTEEIMKVNKEFLFGCGTGSFDTWQGADSADRKGVIGLHAYSILDAREVKGERLVRIRNPWGEGEWRGAWSDGSEQWTAEWMQLLDHKFGDDGMFWMSYKDLLRNYQSFNRTRLFGPDWHITQQWTTLDVAWSPDYNDTKFSITLTKQSPVVIVLSQLDDRYFRGLEGQYTFSLHFRLEKDSENDYIVRSHGNYRMSRSVSADLDLVPGTYSVLMKITAKKWPTDPTPEQIIRQTCRDRPEKLTQIGLAYDLAHAKGAIKETDKEKKNRQEREEKKKAAARKKQREDLRAAKFKQWQLEKKQRARDKRHAKRKEEHDRKKAEKRKLKEPQDTLVLDEKATPEVNGDATGKGPSNEGAKTDGAIEIQATEPQTNGLVPLPTISEEMVGKEQQTNGLPKETQTAKPQPEDASSVPSNVADKPAEVETTGMEPAEAKGIEALSTEAKAPQEPSTEAQTSDVAKAEQFQNALQAIPSVQVNGEFIPPVPAPPPSTIAGPDDWQYDSDASFDSSIDSDLDLPPEPPSDENLEEVAPEDDEENAEFADDPWNAVCVVGLRVYSKDSDLSVEIVRPRQDDEDADTPLDVDDASKGASAETVPNAKVEA